MAKANKVRYITPTGVAKYPHLNKPDEYEGKRRWSTKLVLPREEAEPLVAQVDEAWAAAAQAFAKEAKTPASKRALKAPHLPYTEELDRDGNETGNVEFSFSRPAEFVDRRTGEAVSIRIGLFDAKLKPLTEEVWGGSKIKVAYELNPYHTGANAGVQLRLVAAQVIDLVTRGDAANGSVFGFSEEDGFVSAAATGDGDEPWDADSEDIGPSDF